MKMTFLAILLLVIVLASHVYLFRHVYKILPFLPCVKIAVLVAMAVSFILFFIAMSPALDLMPFSLSKVIYEVGTSWIFVFLYLLILFVLFDIGKLVHIVPGSFLVNSVWGTVSVAFLLISVFVYGNINYYNKYCQQLELTTTKNIKRGKKIVLLSDLHLGYHNTKDDFSKWVDMINAENPDLVLVAGDIIDRSVVPLLSQKISDEFHRIKAPVFACLGNHEYYAGSVPSCAFYDEAGITLLRDSAVTIDGITIIGRDDRTNASRKGIEEILKRYSVNTDSSYVILLDHQPYNLEQAENAHIDFQFSGHTHYGQVWPISLITDAIYEDAFGPCQKGNTSYYVSSGIGIWGGKFRIGTRSEYIALTLTSSSK